MTIWAFPSFYPYEHPGLKWGGIFAHRQFKGLMDNGADVKVIQPVNWHPAAPFCNLHEDWKQSAKLNYPAQREYDGISVFHPKVKNMKPGRLFRIPYRERYINSIIDFFNDNKIVLDPAKDIFYSQWLPDSDMVQAAAKKLGVRSAVLMIGDDVLIWPNKNELNLQSFKRVLIQADKRFSVAKYLGDEANKLVGELLPFDTVRRGVNYDFFKPVNAQQKEECKAEYKVPAGKVVILTIGSAIVRKGWLDLLDALEEIKKVNDNFILIGIHAGSVEIDLNEEVKKRGLVANFINQGEVDPKQINRLYNSADIFCLPSHWEGIANSVVEAMSTGLPVVTTNVCGHPELIENNVTGIMVAPKKPKQLEKELLELITNEAKRKQLGYSARNFIVNTWGSFADNAAKLYEKIEETLA